MLDTFITNFDPRAIAVIAAGTLLVPVLTLTSLVAVTTLVAILADRDRGARAHQILRDLLDVLLAILRCGRGGRR